MIWQSWDKRSERVKEQHKLWQQRGTLERTRANLVVLSREIMPVADHIALSNAVTAIDHIIASNKLKMGTISKRIPSGK